MRIRMSVLAAGLVAGALALGTSSVDANPQIALNGMSVVGQNVVMIDAPAAAAGELCIITQAGQPVGGTMLMPGPNAIAVANNGMSSVVVADGPNIQACSAGTGNLDDSPEEY